MKIRILSWNVRGANDRDKRKIIKSVIKSQRVDVVCLQETKIKEMTIGIVRSLGVGRHLDLSVVNSRGATGGILVFWDNRVFELVDLEEGEYSISFRFKNCVDGVVWVFTSVYGPVYSTDREDFWDEFGSIRGLWSDPWCVGGDFNMIRFPEEYGRGGGLSASMRRFSEVVEDLELRDFPLQGGPFTWRGGLNIQSHSRLDRFLVIDNWDNLFNGAVQGVLPRPIFDHFPILLEGGMKRGPFPFRFENTWLEEGFKDQMKTWWGSLSFTRTSNFVLDAKLREDILKTWNKEVFGLIETKKGEALRQVMY